MASIFDSTEWDNSTRGAHRQVASIPQPIPRQIFEAASRGNLAKVENLLQNNQDCTILNDLFNGFNALHMSAKKGHTELVKLLLTFNPALLGSRSQDLRDAYMIASYEGHIRVLEILHSIEIEFGDTNYKDNSDKDGNGSVHFAAWGGHLDCVQYLVEVCGRSPNTVNRDHISPLQYAAAGNHTAIIEYLSSFATVEDDQSASGMSPLHRAAAYGSFETVQLLCTNMKLQSRTQNGSTPLHFACQHGHFRIAEYMCTMNPAGVDVENDVGMTPLHFACMGGYTLIASLLVKHHANPLKSNKSGENAFHIAAANGNHSICNILHKITSIDPFLRDVEGKSVIDKAMEGGFKELANSLVFWSCINWKAQEFMNLIDI